MFYEFVKFVMRPLLIIAFWPRIKGRDKVPGKGPLILAGNHLGTGETFLLPALVRPQLTFPAKKELFEKKGPWGAFSRWFFTAIHQVPMDRSGGNVSAGALGTILDCLNDGGVVAIYPEGHRSPDGRLYKGRTGVARLAFGADCPIIPVGCFRTRFVWKWLPFPWLFRPELVIGDEFRLPEDSRQRYLNAETHEEARQALREATDIVMKNIQQVTGQEMVDEYSLHPKKVKALAKQAAAAKSSSQSGKGPSNA